MKFWNRPKAAEQTPRTAEEQYAINEKNRSEHALLIEEAIPNNIGKGDFALAAYNYSCLADCYTDLGLLHWRHGLDPRADFAKAAFAYENVCTLAQQHSLPKNVAEMPVVYAMLTFLGRTTAIEFEDAEYYKEHRWPCYESCVVHALHDQPLDAYHDQLLNTYLGTNEELADQIVRAYFELLGSKGSVTSADRLVEQAEANWTKRKHSRFFADGGPGFHGYGIMNEIYVDIYLAAILHKIGWVGESEHRWRW